VTGHIVGDARASAQTRLEVYYQAYRLRLLEILGNDFEGLAAMLGADDFATMVGGYIAAHPSAHPSVRWFGRHLPGYLQATPPWAGSPALAEMASFEWSWGLAFDAADAAPAEPSQLAALAPESWAGLRVSLHPSVQRVTLAHNVPEIFAAATRSSPLPPVAAGEARPWVLWRCELVVHWRSLDRDEAWALDAAARGQDFGALCEGLCEWHAPDAVPLRAASLLRTWLEEGLLAAVQA
jgi:hypothetical protein